MTSSHRYPWKWWLRDLKPPMEDAPTVFSTFACGGGSSMGYKRAGFMVVGNCEIDPKIAAVYEANLHPPRSYVMDLREFNTLEDLPEELYHLDVLDGSPPCSTFSIAGSREKAWGVEKQFAEGQKLQRLDDLFFTYLETVEKLMPKAFVAENVVGLVRGNAKGYVNEILKRAHEIGYEVQLFRLDAAFMGVPQRRERVFFIANRMGWPKLRLQFDEPVIDFRDCRTPNGGDELRGKVRSIAQEVKPYERDLKEACGRLYGNIGFFNYRMNYDDMPANTVTASVRNIRFCDMSYVTDEDTANVSTFPQDYDFGGLGTGFICGMSVPPSMMANIAHEIRTQWLES